jgi:hypothetical protein
LASLLFVFLLLLNVGPDSYLLVFLGFLSTPGGKSPITGKVTSFTSWQTMLVS